ncbi:MAG TPA: aminotransferase class V-fold PLP-dependent enzyme [Bryobacteraceae bacterium]|nr:aminotransferase class V-fold PLP-dependent enzyme [Bryobacteraceae bacterium]
MPNRRGFLQALSSLPVLGAFLSPGRAATDAAARDYFQELGVRPFVNAGEPYTTLTGSLMAPEVVAAMDYASRRYVRLEDLHDAVGRRIAALTGAEAAMVTAGAASALTLGTAACLTGADRERIHRLPDTSGLKNEVVIQKSHRYGYDHAVRNCGTRFVEVETKEELEQALGSRTAMMLFYNRHNSVGKIPDAEFVELGRKHGVPTFNDCAGDAPPAENLSKYLRMGFDLVAFSGGKGLRGPQSAGLLLGRRDLIQAARLNGSPNSDAIGRGQKVNKEELLGMMVAVERIFRVDQQSEWREYEARVQWIAGQLSGIPGVRAEMFVPEVTYRVPHLRVRWDESAVRLSPRDAIRRLREGEPSIEVRSSPPDCVELGVWMLQPGEERVVARRLGEILKSA